MFVDQIKVQVRAGDGGNGCVSFRREKFVPKGGPDGGDGGRGGDIILRVDQNVDTLAGFFYEPIIRGKQGGHGTGKNCYGRQAKPTVVHVPVGTLVYRFIREEPVVRGFSAQGEVTYLDIENSEEEPDPILAEPLQDLIVDLTELGQEFILCKGGEGGKGNVHFKSGKNRIPKECTPGDKGEAGEFVFEMRKIADAGLVGYPNAGKSTLLSKLSSARPKVAAYPFTTLHPMVGVLEFQGYARATVADIPGLIEGAHANIGLGHEFLRHIVRCKLLLHVIDMAGSEGRSPLDDLGKLREELKLYDPTLADRPWMIIANKMDLEGAKENLKRFKQRFKRVEIIPISAEKGEGIDALKERLLDIIKPVVK